LERYSKITKDRHTIFVNRTDTSISYSKQLDNAISASKITALSSVEFVNPVADKPGEKIKINIFHAEIINDAKKMNEEVNRYKDIEVVSNIIKQPMQDNYTR